MSLVATARKVGSTHQADERNRVHQTSPPALTPTSERGPPAVHPIARPAGAARQRASALELAGRELLRQPDAVWTAGRENSAVEGWVAHGGVPLFAVNRDPRHGSAQRHAPRASPPRLAEPGATSETSAVGFELVARTKPPNVGVFARCDLRKVARALVSARNAARSSHGACLSIDASSSGVPSACCVVSSESPATAAFTSLPAVALDRPMLERRRVPRIFSGSGAPLVAPRRSERAREAQKGTVAAHDEAGPEPRGLVLIQARILAPNAGERVRRLLAEYASPSIMPRRAAGAPANVAPRCRASRGNFSDG